MVSAILIVGIYIILVPALAIVVLWVLDRIRSRRWRAKQHDPFDPYDVAIAKRKRRQRLMNPNWGDFEARFRTPPPNALRRWFADHDLITTDSLINLRDSAGEEIIWDISDFDCMDAREFETRWDCLDDDLLEIASDGFGNPFVVRITGDMNDPLPVSFWMHDGGTDELEPVCASLDEFRELIRRSRHASTTKAGAQ